MTDDRSEEERLADQESRAYKELHRAHRAEQIYGDELFEEAVAAVKDQLWEDFARTELSDDDTRRNARIGLAMLDGILKSLRRHIETGKMAKKSLADVEAKRSWLQRLKARAA
jgi:hypothetical protein